MKKFTPFAKFVCLFFIFKVLFVQSVNAQVLLQEGFEEDSTGWQITNYGDSKWDVLGGGFNSYKGDKCMYVTTDGFNQKTNCWLVSTPVKFEAGKKYSISFHYKCQVVTANQLEVSIGNSSTTTKGNVVWNQIFTNDTYLKGQINYVASDTKKQYIRFHCTTPQMFTYLYLDEVTVQEVTCFEPLNISFSNIQSTSLTASWDKVDGAASYEYSIFNRDTSTPKVIRSADTNSVKLAGLLPATANYFYVRSRCSATDSSLWATTKFSTSYDCSTFETLSCGDTIDKNYRGKTGLYSVVLCDQPLNGPEFFHKFTPAANGYYKLDCFSAGGNGIPMGFAYKESSLGCGNSDWNCIGISFGFTAMVFGPLQAGHEYIIMEKSDLQAGLPSDYSFKIECYTPPPVNDSCNKAISIPVSDYTANCIGTALTTSGATPENFINDNSCGSYDGSNDDDIWVKFKATGSTQIFRFSNASFSSKTHVLNVDFYTESCNAESLIDCGTLNITPTKYKDIASYYFEKGKTYYCRISTYGIDNTANFNLCIMKPGLAKNPTDSCVRGVKLTLQQKDQGIWVPFLTDSLNIFGALNIDSNSIRNIIPFVFIHQGKLRTDGNKQYYLNRNFNIVASKQPLKPVKVRLYFSNSELNKLIDQPGSNVTSLNDINVTQTDTTCASSFSGSGTLIIPSARGNYDANIKYVEFSTDHLSSFFLHGGTTPLSAKKLKENNASATSLKGNGIKVSPNPFTNVVFIEVNENKPATYKIIVTNFEGKPVRSFEKMLNAGYNKISINMASLAAGVYMLKVETPDSVEYSKIIKQ